MAIAITCRCGKQMKVKDRLAGKAVRCPACKKPLRIPSNKTDGGEQSAIARQAQEAILRIEKLEKERQKTEEEVATYKTEQKKLIEGYDQLSGKKQKGKDKKKLEDERPRKATIFTKIADAFGVVFGNLLVKYCIFAVLFSGAALGSVYLIRYVGTYIQDETAPPTKPKEQRVKDLFKEAQAAIEACKWSAARDALEEIIRLDPGKAKHRDYRAMKKTLDESYMKH